MFTIDPHHDTAVRHRDVLKCLHAERQTASLTLLRRSAQGRPNIHWWVFSFLDMTVKSKIIILTQGMVACHSGAELPGFPQFGACCRGSWGQGPLESLLPHHLLSKVCSPSHPVRQDMTWHQANSASMNAAQMSWDVPLWINSCC